jgi:hypothetical protein
MHVKNNPMRIFSSFQNPKTKRYATYYSVVLVIVSGTILFSMFQVIHLNLLQNVMTFFEGFFSLYMLNRNKIVRTAFLSHIFKAKAIIKP